jgi:hypothetical protein
MTWNADMAADAAGHVADFGRSCVYTKRVAGAFNTTTGKRAATETTHTLTMVKAMVQTSPEFGQAVARRVHTATFSITAADLATAGITVDTNDRVTDADSIEFTIQEINHRMDGALVVLTCKRTAP